MIALLPRFFLLAALGISLAACSSSPKAPEPVAYPSLPADALSMKRLWKVSVGNGLDGSDSRLAPAVGERLVAAASHDGVLLAVDRETGKVLWKNATQLEISAGPSMAYGVLVVATTKGEVVAFSPEEGKELWRASLGAGALSTPGISAKAVVVLSVDGVVHALARDSGSVLWTYNTSVPPLSLRGSAAPLMDDERVYIATSAGKLLGMNADNGVLGWDTRVATNAGRSELERMNDIVGNMVQAADGVVFSIGYQSQLTATNPDTGRRLWQYDASSVNNLAMGLGNIYFSDVSGHLYAVDQHSGKVVWKQTDYAWHQLTAPVVVSSVLAVGDERGRVHFLAQSDGQVRGRVRMSGDPLVALAAQGDVLYGWDKQGHLSAWQVQP